MNHYLIYYNRLFSYNRLCLCCLNNKIIAGFDSGKLAGMILLDFWKPFETINHQMLLKQLYAFRFSNNIIPGLSHTRQKKNANIYWLLFIQFCQSSSVGSLTFLLYVGAL